MCADFANLSQPDAEIRWNSSHTKKITSLYICANVTTPTSNMLCTSGTRPHSLDRMCPVRLVHGIIPAPELRLGSGHIIEVLWVSGLASSLSLHYYEEPLGLKSHLDLAARFNSSRLHCHSARPPFLRERPEWGIERVPSMKAA